MQNHCYLSSTQEPLVSISSERDADRLSKGEIEIPFNSITPHQTTVPRYFLNPHVILIDLPIFGFGPPFLSIIRASNLQPSG